MFPARAQVEKMNAPTTPAEKQETPFTTQVASYITALETRVNTLEEVKSSLPKSGRSELFGIREVLTTIHNPQARNLPSALVSLLRSEHVSARKHSCHLLGLLGDEVVAGALFDTFKNDAVCRQEAGQALGLLGNSGARALVSTLKSDDEDVVVAALNALGDAKPGERRPDSLITESLISVLWRKDNTICDAAVRALGSYANEQSVAAIIRSLQDTNIYSTGSVSARALERIGRPCLPLLHSALNKCNTTNDADFAVWAAAALADIGAVESIETLDRIARSVWSLPDHQPAKRPSNPMELSKDDDPLSAWNWRNNKAIGTLELLLRFGNGYDREPRPDACAQATYALARIGTPALTNLMSLTKGPNPWGRCCALEGLFLLNLNSPIKEPRAILAIIERIHDQDEQVRITARRALKSITRGGTMHEIFASAIYSSIDLDQLNDASDLAATYQALLEDDIVQVFSFGSEHQRLTYMDTMQGVKHPFSLLARLPKNEQFASAILRLKGIVLDSLLEDALAAATFEPAPGQIRRALKLKVSDVQSVLPKDAALLEFVRYHHYDKGGSELRYGVMMIGGGDVAFIGSNSGMPVWVPLGSAATIEQTVKGYRDMMRGDQRGEADLLHSLYTLLFEPIQQKLPSTITTLIVSPDAELNFVNLATLLDARDQFLAEKYTIKYVTCGRDMAFERKAGKATRQMSVFANPAFGVKPARTRTSKGSLTLRAIMASDPRDYAGVNLLPLPGTAMEAGYLRDKSASWRLQGNFYEGAEASEAEVMAVNSPYILHLATHGFFLADTHATNQTTMPTSRQGRSRPVVFHNPMQRSGLALAGAQLTMEAWNRGERPDTKNDGILTAEDVGIMNLKNTWLVVLSACDTGIGETRNGEGVMGLRRGFSQAGAQNLLMTLWPVSDRWSVEIMKAFYERALLSGDAPGTLATVQREFLVKLKTEKSAVIAARIVGPFVMTFHGN